ncbi:MAG: alanine--glyoxylate aminotransferase family protein [Candidatus Kapabacteria bacterium]|nr:alanine--glyoxylate aminotransferase family protein [Candidatus Kapabacteria bacterium]
MRSVFFPGPSFVPQESIAAMSKEIVHHHSKEFSNVLTNIQNSLKKIVKCSGNIFLLTGSGTTTAESIVDNFLVSIPTTQHLVCCNGRFSKRWAVLLQRKKFTVLTYDEEHGVSHSPSKLLEYLENNPSISTVWFVHGETSTGVLNPIEKLVRIVKSFNPSILCIVDAVSSIGTEYFYFDDWNIDIAFTSSCKGLISPAGLGCVFTKKEILGKNDLRFSDSLGQNVVAQPWTPPIQLYYAFEHSLEMICNFGTDRYIQHVADNKKYLCDLLSNNYITIFGENSLHAVTVLALPPRKNFLEILNNEHAIKLIGAQDHLQSDYFRIGNFGFIEKSEIEQLVSIISTYY